MCKSNDTMKLLKLLFLVLTISCTKSNSSINPDKYSNNYNINSGDKSCENIFQFGKANLCIPKIEGMYNIINNIESKDYIQSKNFPGNTFVAYYVNKKLYKNLQVLWEDQFDDFFQIYVTNHNENKDVDISYFTEVNKNYLENYLNSDKWETLKKRLENINENNVFEKPILIESYSLSKNSMQYVTLVTIKKKNTSKNMIAIGNMFIVQNRLFFSSYNKFYQNFNSIEEAKKRNNELMLKIIDNNK
ncbi:hypothetical protein EMIT036CA2_10291 [Chryseobacterium sp. IT-36CA2]